MHAAQSSPPTATSHGVTARKRQRFDFRLALLARYDAASRRTAMPLHAERAALALARAALRDDETIWTQVTVFAVAAKRYT